MVGAAHLRMDTREATTWRATPWKSLKFASS
jgi:hypothetical protein